MRVLCSIAVVLSLCLAVAGLSYAHNDDSNTMEFVILANSHYDATSLKDLTYEDANWVYDSLTFAHGWTCVDYKAWDTIDHGDSRYLPHSSYPTAHNPNYYGDRPEAVSENIYNTHFWYDGPYDADSADLLYFMGHGWNSLPGPKYGVLGLHRVLMSPPSNEEYFSPQLVGSGWAGDLEWGVLAACSALKYLPSSPSTSGAQYYADAMANGVHGFVGYKTTAPSWPGDSNIAEWFLSDCFGDPYRQVDPMTIREAWIDSNVHWGQSSAWACLFHDDNENDYLPGSGYAMGPDSHSRSDIYYWDSSYTRIQVQDTSLATPSDDRVATQSAGEEALALARHLVGNGREFIDGNPTTVVVSDASAHAHAVVHASGALEYRRGSLLGEGKPVGREKALRQAAEFIAAYGGVPSDAAAHSAVAVTHTRMGQRGDGNSEVVAYAVEYRQYAETLPIYGQNVIRVWVTAGGITGYDRAWLEGAAAAANGPTTTSDQALALALSRVDRCQGVPEVTAVEQCIFRPSAEETSIVGAWRVDFSDGQTLFVTDEGQVF